MVPQLTIEVHICRVYISGYAIQTRFCSKKEPTKKLKAIDIQSHNMSDHRLCPGFFFIISRCQCNSNLSW